MPNTYARGILFGKMILELGDISSIRNDELEYRCDVDFRTKVSRITDSLQGGETLTRPRAGSRAATMSSLVKSRDPTTTTSET